MQNSFLRSLSGLGALVLSTAVWAEGHIDSVTGRASGDAGATVSIVGHNLTTPTVSRVGHLYILQFDAGMDGRNKKFTVDGGGVDDVRLTWFARNPAKVRLTMRLDGTTKPRLEKSSEGYEVFFGDAKGTTTTAPAKAISAAITRSTFPEHIPAITTTPRTVTTSQSANVVTTVSSPRVSLDFVNTDVVQILKALAMQANVNIVTAPEVGGRLSVSLNAVPLTEALDFVTAMAGVRYTRMGDTYVVTSSSKFSEAVQRLNGNVDLATETRVVPIFSHQGIQVKAALLRSVPPSTLNGKYDLLLSNEEIGINQELRVAPQGDAGAPGKADAGAKGNDPTVTTKTRDAKETYDNYMMIVGTPARLDEVERMARAIDTSICNTMGVRIPTSNGVVQKSYEPRGISAEDLVASLKADKDMKFGDVQMFATPKTSLSRQVVMISGRSNDVENMLQLLNSMDSMADGGPSGYEVVGLNFVKPQLAMVEVLDAVPGIRAKLLPAPVEPNVGITYTDTARQGTALSGGGNAAGSPGSGGGAPGGGSNGGSPGGSGSGTPPSTGGSSGGSSGGGGSSGVAAPPTSSTGQVTDYSAQVATFQTPMKLLLKGTPEQIADAKRMLAMIDVAPRQVALELRVMELSYDDALQVGLNLSALTGGSLSSIVVNNALGDTSTVGGVGAKLNFGGGGSLSALGKLDQITTRNNLIARPSILASDGSLTHIFVGDEVRYIQSIQASQNGTTVTTGQVNVGVDFFVTPRIGSAGNITLDLHPTFSILQGFTAVPGGGELPQTSSRTAETLVNMKSGETIAIGGLIQDQDRKSYGGIPLLKDLPIIGKLFARTDNHKVRSEVVFFITAREVDETNRQSPANPREAEKINKQWPGGGPNHGPDKTGH